MRAVMMGRLGSIGLAALALMALAGAGQATATTISARCVVDVGAPVILVDETNDGQHATVGGCVLVDHLDHPAWVSDLDPGDSDRTPFVHDCVLLYDEDADGTGFDRIGASEEVPQGARVWASCDSGLELVNRIELTAAN